MENKNSVALVVNGNSDAVNSNVTVSSKAALTSIAVKQPLSVPAPATTTETTVNGTSNGTVNGNVIVADTCPARTAPRNPSSPVTVANTAPTTTAVPNSTCNSSSTATTVTTTNSSSTVTTTQTVNGNQRDNDLNLNVFFGVMRNESERLLTFEKWPLSFISKESLANAGFFYLYNSDRVQCAFCKGVICYWEPDDVPLQEHKRHYPRCPFIMGYEVGNNPIDKDPIRGEKRRLGRDVCGGYHRIVSPLPTQESLLKTYTLPPMTVNLEEFGVLVHKGARNAKYASRDYRTVSFSAKWPKDCKYQPEQIAEAGFYYCGVSDCVKCFYCDVGVCDWKSLRDPWTEHAIRSPNCDYLVLNKGIPFIQSAQKIYAEEVLKVSPLTEAAFAEKAVNEWMESKVVKDLLSIHDYSKDILRAVLQKRWEDTRVNYEHLGELNSAVVSYITSNSKNEQSNVMEHVSSSQESLVSEPPDSPLSMESGIRSMESCESSPASISPLSSSPPSTSASPPPSSEKERLICKMCLDREIGVVFLPCGHMACTQCAPGVTSCPVCRTVIKGTVRTFLA